MDRQEKKNYISSLIERNKIINKKLKDVSNPTLEEERDTNEKLISEARRNATRILIKTTHPIEARAYRHLYYLMELDEIESLSSDKQSGYADIDLSKMFDKFRFPMDERGDIRTNSHMAKRSRAIMRSIIDDMFSKKAYQSWSEVKEDLLKVQASYEKHPQNKTR